MTGRLEGKIAIITGAARGTGAATARLFVEEGAQVCLADVLDDAGQAEALELGDAAMFQHMDVRSEGDWKRAVEATRERFGPVNVLVNNAAILDVGPIAELDVEKARDILDVNLIGPMIGTSAVLGDMQEAGGGAIVNIGSIDAMEGMGWVAPYSASKWGLRGFTKSAALELGQLGIRVNLVCPAGGSPELTQGFISNIQQRRDAGETIELSARRRRATSRTWCSFSLLTTPVSATAPNTWSTAAIPQDTSGSRRSRTRKSHEPTGTFCKTTCPSRTSLHRNSGLTKDYVSAETPSSEPETRLAADSFLLTS
jgi:3alpha(or 20beta)-hydroxysteroid dehydrogenase